MVFATLKHVKDQLFKTSELPFDTWLFGPEKFSGLSRNSLHKTNKQTSYDHMSTLHLLQQKIAREHDEVNGGTISFSLLCPVQRTPK